MQRKNPLRSSDFSFANRFSPRKPVFESCVVVIFCIKIAEVIFLVKFSPNYWNEHQREFCERADVDAVILVYTGNSLFSPEFKRERYLLEQDVSAFLTNVREILAQEGIQTVFGKVYRIVTTVDYLANAIEPLVWNIRNHAFNPRNNIYNRPMDKKFSRYLQISGDSERVVKTDGAGFSSTGEPVSPGFFVVEVRDNGFGIREEDIPHIFNKDFSTKTDALVQHGIGLHGVKSFVERYGGTISVESKLDKGSTFKFSIPYNSVQNAYCIQSELPVVS